MDVLGSNLVPPLKTRGWKPLTPLSLWNRDDSGAHLIRQSERSTVKMPTKRTTRRSARPGRKQALATVIIPTGSFGACSTPAPELVGSMDNRIHSVMSPLHARPGGKGVDRTRGNALDVEVLLPTGSGAEPRPGFLYHLPERGHCSVSKGPL